MLPSTSAYSRFCDGADSSFAAARNSAKLPAVLILSNASMDRPGVSPTQLTATAYGGLPGAVVVEPTDCSDVLTSDSSGPCRDVRMRSDRGCASPRTEISSVRISSGALELPLRTCAP